MRNGVQALYRSVRDDPEAAAALRKQGISTHDDEGNQRSTADLARALSNVLQKLDGKQANELGKQLNLDASVIEALRNPRSRHRPTARMPAWKAARSTPPANALIA